MMTEETLNKLFDQARNEALETKASDIQKWIGLGALGIILSGLLTKTKLIITLKPFIMISSTFVAVGIGVGTVFVLSSKEAPKVEIQTPKTDSKTVWNQKNKPVLEEQTATEEKSAASATTPVNPVGKTWGGLFSPMPFSDSFCMEPVAGIRPIAPIAPLAPIRRIIMNDDNQDYGYFNALKLSGGVEVVVKQGDECGVRLEGDAEATKNIVLKNTNKTLEVYTDYNEKKKNTEGHVTVYVTVKNDLTRIQCSGATVLASEGELSLSSLNITCSGASDIDLKLKISDLKITSSGASKMVFSGDTDKLTLTASGASDFISNELSAKQVRLDFSGASRAKVKVTENLNIKAAGASDIEYVGDPNTVDQEISGGSSVKHKKS